MTVVTFGQTTPDPGGSFNFFGQNQNWATLYTLTGSDPSAVLTRISAYMQSHPGLNPFLCVWRDVAGTPGALVGYGTPATPAGPGWYDVASPTLVDMGGAMPDGDYWLGFQTDSGFLSEEIWGKSSGYTGYFGGHSPPPANPLAGGSGNGWGMALVADATFSSAPPPSNVSPPVASGTVVPLGIVTSTDGIWNDALTFTHQWQRSDDGITGWADLSGETNASYSVMLADVGKYLRDLVTAHGTGGDTDQASNVLGPVVPYPSVTPFSVVA